MSSFKTLLLSFSVASTRLQNGPQSSVEFRGTLCDTRVYGFSPTPHFFHLAVAKGKAEGALIPSMTDLLINLLD